MNWNLLVTSLTRDGKVYFARCVLYDVSINSRFTYNFLFAQLVQYRSIKEFSMKKELTDFTQISTGPV